MCRNSRTTTSRNEICIPSTSNSKKKRTKIPNRDEFVNVFCCSIVIVVITLFLHFSLNETRNYLSKSKTTFLHHFPFYLKFDLRCS